MHQEVKPLQPLAKHYGLDINMDGQGLSGIVLGRILHQNRKQARASTIGLREQGKASQS